MNGLIVARYNENINWLSYLTRKPNWEVHVYNDGGKIDETYSKDMHVKRGDKVPAEASKYIRFIIENYDKLDSFKWLVFIQADPFEHSPDFIGLLENMDLWNKEFQGLTYMGHPLEKWGPDFLKHDTYTEDFINNNRLWCDKNMDNKFQGELWKCSWLEQVVNKKQIKPLKEFWEYIENPYEIPEIKNKWYSACFATTSERIKMYDKDFWIRLEKKVSTKITAINMEYVWSLLFTVSEKKLLKCDKNFGIVLKNGIGDKLLDLLGGCIYSEAYGKELNVALNMNNNKFVWGKALYDTSLFNFDDIERVKVSNVIDEKQQNRYVYIDVCNPSVTLSPYSLSKVLKDTSIETIHKKLHNFAKQIKPSTLIKKLLPVDFENTYGVHLRKSDKIIKQNINYHELTLCEHNTLITELKANLKKLIKDEPKAKFFVCSEDNEYKNEFIEFVKSVGGTVIDYDKIGSVPIDGLYEIMDLFCLSKCKAIFQGTRYSTFSLLASLIGSSKLVNYYKGDSLLNLWSDGMTVYSSYPDKVKKVDAKENERILGCYKSQFQVENDISKLKPYNH